MCVLTVIVLVDGTAILDKIFGPKQRNSVKLDRKKKVSTYFCVFLTAIVKV